jgi:hypothetical protein
MVAATGQNMYVHDVSIPGLCQLSKSKQVPDISKVAEILLTMF